ncbi:MAG: Asp-tRNA(Asn)/Glu-tRNA(Gln) amidotransferase subunit GatC [Leptospiraceae bacterium]|nr:Asp-tRNA(Asn)/Glu-tRNA(Gln) amidotransferase subunit GatC [Leptospiraceae bacterium]
MLSEKEFKQLAHLARLDPEDESLAGLRDDFNRILEYVDRIQSVDTSGVDDRYSVNETINVYRSDEPMPTLESDEIGRFAPQWEAGHFVVPGVIESEG